MRTIVRCPSDRCRDLFEVATERLGRNIYCLSCGDRMTARSTEVDHVLAERERRLTGSAGAQVRRLPLSAVLDDIRSLWNVGSMFRTADGCGVESLVLAGITGCPPRHEISKTALGAEEVVTWRYRKRAIEAIAEERDRGYLPIAVETTGDATPLNAMPWPEKVCLVMGNEVAGVSPAILDLCESRVSIPMLGVKNSLNVAVAFGIAAHAAAAALMVSSPGETRSSDTPESEGHDG